jgi:hypothetical protein
MGAKIRSFCTVLGVQNMKKFNSWLLPHLGEEPVSNFLKEYIFKHSNENKLTTTLHQILEAKETRPKFIYIVALSCLQHTNVMSGSPFVLSVRSI